MEAMLINHVKQKCAFPREIFVPRRNGGTFLPGRGGGGTFSPRHKCPPGHFFLGTIVRGDSGTWEKLSGGQPCLGKNVRGDSERGGQNFLRQRHTRVL